MLEGGGVQGGGELDGRKNWDNCNSITNKIYFKNAPGDPDRRTGRTILPLVQLVTTQVDRGRLI